MAVPKKRTGHSAQGHRRSNWKATKPEVTTCANCGQPVLTHTVCSACGYYKGKAVSIKSPDYVETPAEVKKPSPKKKSTKKAKTDLVEHKAPENEPKVGETTAEAETAQEEKPEE